VDYSIKLEKVYEGPIAVLYELVKAAKIDLYDIPIAEILEQYLGWLKVASQSLNIDLSAEFILMAATLMHIKSQMLLPHDGRDDSGSREDPRRELIEKLLEYQKFKGAAQVLENRDVAHSDLIFREKKQYIFDYNDEANWVDISIYDLLNAFSKIVEFIEEPRLGLPLTEEITVAMRINAIVERIRSEEKFYFGELFSDRVTRIEVIVNFLAILELVKANRIRVQQHKLFGDIRIIRRQDQ
jgi:segregation and condensation protein A